MNQPTAYKLGQIISIKVNGKTAKAHIFGYELAYWLDPIDWIYHILIEEYSFDIRVQQSILINGINIVTNGNTAKVLPLHEEVKTK